MNSKKSSTFKSIKKEAINFYEIKMQRQTVELVQMKIQFGSYRKKSTVLLVLATTLLITLQCISCSTINEEPQLSDVFADREVRRLFSDDVNGEHLALLLLVYR